MVGLLGTKRFGGNWLHSVYICSLYIKIKIYRLVFQNINWIENKKSTFLIR